MAVTPTTIGPSAEELEAGTGGDPVALEGSGTEISVPDWISRAEAFQRSGDDLLIVGPDGQKAIISGFFSSGAMPRLITFTGEELPVEDVLVRVEAGDPFEVAQAQTGGAATDAPLIQSETGAAPDTPTSLESLLVSLSNGAELDASLVDVFQQAVNEAVAQGASPDQATDAEPAFLQTLIEQVAQGATPEAALENAKAVFQAVAQATGEVDGPAQGGGLMQALASGENVDDVVGQLVQQQGGGLSADQVAAATNAFVEGLQQGLAEGAQPGDALAQAAVASQGAAEAEVVGELSGADALLAALASGDNADQVLTDLGVPADGDAGAAFADSLANALQSGQALDAALTDAADAQTLLAQAVADSQDPNIADPVLAALASGDNLEGVVGDSAAFQEALAQALQGGAAPGDALQQAGDTLATLDAAQAQTNDPAADPLLAALASGDNVEGAVGDSEAFAENLANALEGGGSFTDAVQAANDQTASVDQALAQQTVPGGGDPVLAALASGGNVGQTLDELSSNDAGAASLVAALASGSSGTEAVQIVGDQSIAISDAISDTTTASAGEAAVVVDGALTVTEANAANFDGGQFTAQVTTNNTAADRLTITNQGTGAGQIGFDGTTVTFAGTAIGTVNGANNGTGTAPLTIDLNTNATPAAVQALARNVTYRNTDTSGTAVSDPVVSFTLAESNGTVSVTSTRTIDVNVRPVLTATAGSVAASAGETAVAVDTGLTVTDADSTDFSGGQFTAQVTTNNTAADRLTITNQGTGAGQIGFDGTTVTYGGTAIGTVNGANNGTGTAPLRLDLNANATPAAVQALSRAVTYQNTDTSGSAVSDPVVSFTLSDGDGATSAAATRTVDVNVRPVLTVTAGSVAVSAGGSAVTVDSGMTVSDADSADLSGGQFTAQVTTNNTANDRRPTSTATPPPGRPGSTPRRRPAPRPSSGPATWAPNRSSPRPSPQRRRASPSPAAPRSRAAPCD